MANHTPEPWSIDKYGCVTAPSVTALHRSIEVDGFALSGSQLAQLNSQRIVACVNACAGIPDDLLQDDDKNIINRYTQHLRNEAVRQADLLAAVTAQRDELLAALKSLDSALEKAWRERTLPAVALDGEQVRHYKSVIFKCEAQNGQ